jgi:hypothetical protein
MPSKAASGIRKNQKRWEFGKCGERLRKCDLERLTRIMAIPLASDPGNVDEPIGKISVLVLTNFENSTRIEMKNGSSKMKSKALLPDTLPAGENDAFRFRLSAEFLGEACQLAGTADKMVGIGGKICGYEIR